MGDDFVKIETPSFDFLTDCMEPYDPYEEANYISSKNSFSSFTVSRAISNLGHKIYNLRTEPHVRLHYIKIWGIWTIRKYGTNEIIEAIYVNPFEELAIVARNEPEANNIFEYALFKWFYDSCLQHGEDFIPIYIKKEARDIIDLAERDS